MTCQELIHILNEYADADGGVDFAVYEPFEQLPADSEPCQVAIDNIRQNIMLYQEGQAYKLPGRFREPRLSVLGARWQKKHSLEERS